MKKYLYITTLFMLLTITIFAQTINVHTNDGAVYSYTLSEIDSITFTVENAGMFECGISTITYYEKTYNTIQIGSQCWLKENLNVGTMITSGNYERNNNVIEKRCYNEDTSNCEIYGGLYYWGEAMQYSDIDGSQGICPNNWHIPTYVELQTLKNEVGESSNALKALGAGTGTNTSGFTALLGGLFYDGRYFNNLGIYGFFWSSTDSVGSSSTAKLMTLGNSDDNISIGGGRKIMCYSIRCIKD